MPVRPLRVAAPPILAMLGCVQILGSNAGSFAGALTAGFSMHGHEHALSLRPDLGHVDVVLHHGEDDHAVDAPAPLGLGIDAGDHVVHLAAGEGVSGGTRRDVLEAGGLAAAPTFAAAAPTRPAVARIAPAADVGESTRLRTVVLRI